MKKGLIILFIGMAAVFICSVGAISFNKATKKTFLEQFAEANEQYSPYVSSYIEKEQYKEKTEKSKKQAEVIRNVFVVCDIISAGVIVLGIAEIKRNSK